MKNYYCRMHGTFRLWFCFCTTRETSYWWNLSYGTEIESVGIGLKYQYNITDQIRIEPSMNYFFKMMDLACLTSTQISTTFSHSKQY